MAGRQSRPTDHLYCFVPSDNIDIVVLATYLKAFIDGTATLRPSRHPRDTEKLGYTIGANRTLGREALEDLIQDTRDWNKEQQTYEFQDAPYDYKDSDTWADRKDAGATPPGREERPRVVTERRRQQASNKHDEFNPRTLSEISSSTASTQPSSIFSRDTRSTLSDESIWPSDSVSQVQYSTSYGRPVAGGKVVPPRITGGGGGSGGGGQGGGQPDPDSFQKMSLSDSTRPNQGQPRAQTLQNPNTRHGKETKDSKDDDNKARNQRQDPKSGNNRKDQLYDYH